MRESHSTGMYALPNTFGTADACTGLLSLALTDGFLEPSSKYLLGCRPSPVDIIKLYFGESDITRARRSLSLHPRGFCLS